MVWDDAVKYRLLLDINNAIVRETSRGGLFNALAAEIRKIFHYDRFSINLYQAESKKLSYFASADGISPDGIDASGRPLAKGAIAKAVIRSRKPFIIENLADYSFWESVRAMRDAGLNASMAFPLIVRDRILGSIHFSFKKAPRNMTELADFLSELSKQVGIAVDNMLVHSKLKTVNEQLKRQKDFLLSQPDDALRLGEFYYTSNAMNEVFREVQLIAKSDVSVLITGETGTGKDHIAQCIHSLSNRRDALLVKVNCPALTSSLFESELFGHVKGAYTGAQSQRIGRFEMAAGGTVFLDEIAELDSNLQAKLLNVLQYKVIERVGENRPIPVDFRLISASNRNLDDCIVKGTLRSDLYYRINSYLIHIPPLRERPDDIPFLVEKLTLDQAQKTHRVPPRYSSACLEAMCRYHWPGNVRELKNLIKRFVLMRADEMISNSDFEAAISEVQPLKKEHSLLLSEFEKRHILRALDQARGVLGGPKGAAVLLGIPRQTLQYRMRKYGIRTKVKRVVSTG